MLQACASNVTDKDKNVKFFGTFLCKIHEHSSKKMIYAT